MYIMNDVGLLCEAWGIYGGAHEDYSFLESDAV
jgi:hypothetical protein